MHEDFTPLAQYAHPLFVKPARLLHHPTIQMRLNKAIKELNVSMQRVADALKDKGFEGEITLNTKISDEQYELLKKTFA